MQQELAKKVAVVTGASSGIGEATALELGKQGAAVALLARRGERIRACAQKIIDAGGKALAIEADVTTHETLQKAAQQVEKELGRTEILVNNAGVGYMGPFAQQSRDDWLEMIEINLIGALDTTQVFLPQLLAGGGHIVNIASVAGRQTGENFSVYSATKFGLVSWSEALRQELIEQAVRVTVIEPGLVLTEILEQGKSDAKSKAAMEARIQALDPLHAEDIAHAVVYATIAPKNVSINEMLIRPTKEK